MLQLNGLGKIRKEVPIEEDNAPRLLVNSK
jgi:hypothetical protein